MKRLLVLSLAAAFASCSYNTELADLEQLDGPSPVSFSAVVADITPTAPQSKISPLDNQWEIDDAISIFSNGALRGNKATEAAKSALNYKTNIASHNGTWEPVEPGMSWYWVNAVTDHTFYACYPSVSDAAAANYESVPVPDISTQTGVYALSNLQYEYFEFRLAQTATMQKTLGIVLVFNPIFAAIQFNIKLKESDFTDNEAKIKSFTLTSTATELQPIVNGASSTVNLTTGVLTNGAPQTSFKVVEVGEPISTVWNWNMNHETASPLSALVLPNTGKIGVKFDIGGRESAQIELSPEKYEAGKVYTFDVTISAAPEALSFGEVTVTPWDPIQGSDISPEVPGE